MQPIETSYKGYRFRSRLEARWAVFFDALGLRWEYEKEGYDLGPLGWYLPDFWLSDLQTWVEIKPRESLPPRHRIYAAGKISKGDWRTAFFADEQPNSIGDFWLASPIRGTEHDYIGPYFIGCDHGCSHGDNQHGVIGSCLDGGSSTDGTDSDQVVSRCLRAIESCTVLFAWLDSPTCYGTLAEIGYASALQKAPKIWVGIKRDFDARDMWFATKLASAVMYGEDPIHTLKLLAGDEWVCIEQQKMSALSDLTKSPGDVVYGDPIDAFQNSFPRGVLGEMQHNSVTTGARIIQAQNAARSARFDRNEFPGR